MQLYLALDYYRHIPRNLLGFKRREATREIRPVVSAIINDYGAILHKGNFRSAKTKDDPSWVQKVVNPADYGHRRRDLDIMEDLSVLCGQQTIEKILVFDQDIKAIDNLCQRLYGCKFADWDSKISPYYEEVDKHLVLFPDHYLSSLSDKGKFELTINREEGQTYTAAQRSSLFHSHIACPPIMDNDGAMTRANKMFVTMRLANKLHEEFERWHS